MVNWADILVIALVAVAVVLAVILMRRRPSGASGCASCALRDSCTSTKSPSSCKGRGFTKRK